MTTTRLRRRTTGLARGVVLMIGAALLVVGPTGSAAATHPGANGVIYAVTTDGEPVSISPDGVVAPLAPLYVSSLEIGDMGASPDGTQLLVPVQDGVHLVAAD